MIEVISEGVKRTEKIGRMVSDLCRPGDVLCLIGELGTGKTCFTKAVIRGLKVKNRYIGSPTFTLINEYQGKYSIYHFDLYRLKSETELYTLGYEEYFYGKGVTLIEWADKIKTFLPKERVEIYFSYLKENSRRIIFKSRGRSWVSRMPALERKLAG